MTRFLSTLVILTIVSNVSAQIRFETVVAGMTDSQGCEGGIATPIRYPAEQWQPQGRSLIPVTFTLASGDHEHVVGLENTVNGFRVMRVVRPQETTVLYTSPPGYFSYQITQAPNGRIFVSTWNAGSKLLVISPEGQLETIHAGVPAGGSMAVGTDGCTIYYSHFLGMNGAAAIDRFNACTGTSMGTFAAGYFPDLDPLPNGSLLAVAGQKIFLFDATGTLNRTFDLSDYGYGNDMVAAQVAASPDLRSMYVAVEQDCNVYVPDRAPAAVLRISLEDGAQLSRQTLEELRNDIRSLTIGMAALPDAPSVSPFGLIVIIASIAIAGAYALHAR